MEAERKELEGLVMERLKEVDALKLSGRFAFIRKFGYMYLDRQNIAECLRGILEPRGYRMVRCIEEGYRPR